MKAEQLRINPARLMRRLDELAQIGATADGSCCRLALTDEDRQGHAALLVDLREPRGLDDEAAHYFFPSEMPGPFEDGRAEEPANPTATMSPGASSAPAAGATEV